MSYQIVSREEWLRARTALLEQEKALTRHRELVAAERLRLPWVRVETTYVFDGPEGKLTLSDLFQGRPDRLSADHYHPNGPAYAEIAQRMLQVVS